jgi:hypothetical protein
MSVPTSGRRIRATLVLALLLTLLVTPAARACSCSQYDPRDALAAADGAFIGSLVSVGPADEQELAIYTFDVEKVVKGDIGATIDIQAGASDGNCAFSVQAGDRIGLFASHYEGQWASGLCSQILPTGLLGAAAPLPPPDGSGPARYVVGVNIGRHRLMALDARGWTLAYGFGDGYAIDVDVCPGSKRVVEAAAVDRTGVLVVRDLPSLRPIRRIALVSGPWYPRVKVSCMNPSGSHLLAVERHAGEWWVHDLRGTVDRVVWRGPARDVTIEGRRVAIVGGRLLSILPFGAGAPTPVATLPVGTVTPTLSPDGTWVAGMRNDPAGGSEVLVVRTSDGSVRRFGLGPSTFVYGDLVWLDSDRFLFLPTGGQTPSYVFSASSMVPSDGPNGWFADASVVSGGTVYGTAWGDLISARLPDGDPRLVRRFDSPETGVLDVVPRDTA